MNILLLEPTDAEKREYSFPNMLEDDPKVSFNEWVEFAKNKGLTAIKYFSNWDDLKNESIKDPMSPVVICQNHAGPGNRFVGLKKQGIRMFGINNFDYTKMYMSANYVIPVMCRTCDELLLALQAILTEERFTKSVIKGERLDFVEGKLVESQLPFHKGDFTRRRQ